MLSLLPLPGLFPLCFYSAEGAPRGVLSSFLGGAQTSREPATTNTPKPFYKGLGFVYAYILYILSLIFIE